MIFPSQELAQRIEVAECRMLTLSAGAIQGQGKVSPFVRVLASGVATWCGPGSPLNKVAGLGFAGQVEEDDLAEVEAAFHERGERVQVELSTLADPAIGALLTQRGYVLRGFENVLGCALAPGRSATSADGVELRLIEDEEFDHWLDVVVTAFMTPDTQGLESHEFFERAVIENAVADMRDVDGFVRWLADRDGKAVGGASMRIDTDGIAQLSGAATLPVHRKRGVQTSLLQGRLAYAAERGCELAVVTTTPGSKSAENVMKQGFELLYARAILVKD